MSPDHLTEAGARALADRIRAYWAARGIVAEVQVIRVPHNPRLRSPRWDVRSNVKLGVPNA